MLFRLARCAHLNIKIENKKVIILTVNCDEPREDTARTYSTPTFISDNTHPSEKGITAQPTRLKMKVIIEFKNEPTLTSDPYI